MKIEITDGITRQTRKLKDNMSIDRAKELLKELFEDDYLGLDYYLLDDADNEILAMES